MSIYTEIPTRDFEYAEVVHSYRYLNGPTKGQLVRHKLAVAYWKDGQRHEINQSEVEWLMKHGAMVTMQEPRRS